jgi:hypothetical protein
VDEAALLHEAWDADPITKGFPAYVKDAFYAYWQCGILAHGFLWRAAGGHFVFASISRLY